MMYGNSGNVGSYPPSSSTAAAANPANPAIAYPLLHHHQLHHTVMIPLHPPPPLPPFGGGADYDEFPRRDERFPQWSNQETRDLIKIRAQLEGGFTTAKRNMSLWEIVADGMREKGYRRTADQCQSKWKNLVNRYKGQESDVDNVGPFFNELHAVFVARADRMQQSMVEVDDTGVVKGRKRLKAASEDQSNEESTEELEDKEEIEVDHRSGKERAIPKRKAGGEKRQKIRENEDYLLMSDINVKKNDSMVNCIQDIMRNFAQQQQKIDMEWRESMEKLTEIELCIIAESVVP
ncbi:hypothetical protein C2S53_009442 [Perilla frutescens var. hirtella]|uniref:Myb-like domain-containing protein n=1 Tax=Perilla frutescens var. hirtella TaxID=608512 RepID=A0AAD4JCI5_PERFH|nr:hypothetical protein C2S53_009442 [Perilla frutescens var. hirtella]